MRGGHQLLSIMEQDCLSLCVSLGTQVCRPQVSPDRRHHGLQGRDLGFFLTCLPSWCLMCTELSDSFTPGKCTWPHKTHPEAFQTAPSAETAPYRPLTKAICYSVCPKRVLRGLKNWCRLVMAKAGGVRLWLLWYRQLLSKASGARARVCTQA